MEENPAEEHIVHTQRRQQNWWQDEVEVRDLKEQKRREYFARRRKEFMTKEWRKGDFA
jgi:hypothetical protein